MTATITFPTLKVNVVLDSPVVMSYSLGEKLVINIIGGVMATLPAAEEVAW